MPCHRCDRPCCDLLRRMNGQRAVHQRVAEGMSVFESPVVEEFFAMVSG